MKKLLFSLIIAIGILFAINNSYAQSFYFCQNYTSEGDPIGNYTSFDCGSQYSTCYVWGLLNMGYSTNYEYIDLYVFKMNGKKENFYTSYSYYTANVNWGWCAQKMTFGSSGKYKVYVYVRDGSESTLVLTKTVNWNFK